MDTYIFYNAANYMCTSSHCPCPSGQGYENTWTANDDYFTSSGTTYTKFIDCYNDNEELKKDLDIPQDVIDAGEWVEDQFKCSGICTIKDFYFTLDLS